MKNALVHALFILIFLAQVVWGQTPVPVGEEFQVNTYITNNQRYPSVALDGDGDFVVVWVSDGSGGTDSSSSSIQGQRYSADGTRAGGGRPTRRAGDHHPDADGHDRARLSSPL